MAGLRFTTGLDVGPGAGTIRYGNAPAPTSATEAAFGPAAAPSGRGFDLAPNTPGGLAVVAGLGGLLFLILLYKSLPG